MYVKCLAEYHARREHSIKVNCYLAITRKGDIERGTDGTSLRLS